MCASHDPPETFRFNKLRTTGGSTRLTLVKAAVDRAEIDPRPPRPILAYLPAASGIWIGMAVDEYPSQADRVAVQRAVSDCYDPAGPTVGEFPVPLQGKLGSAVTLVPSQLVERPDLQVGMRATTVALGPRALLFVTEEVVERDPDTVARAIEAAKEKLPEPA